MDDHPTHVTKKRTIMKDRVGCVRTSTYNLPPSSHTYGMQSPVNPEGAGELISNWVTADPSQEKKSANMVVYANVLAVKHGCVTAKTMRQYVIDHPNIRLKEALTNDSTRVQANHEGPFGIKTKFADEGMGEIIQAKFTDFNTEDADYPSVSSIKKTGYMPTPKPTIASESITLARMKAAEKSMPSNFTMKRFQNIPGKVFTGPNASAKGSPGKSTKSLRNIRVETSEGKYED